MKNHDGIKLIIGDKRTIEAKHWMNWLGRVPAIRQAFDDWDFDPFHFNEAASVAILSNAAAQAGFLALTEYVLDKRHATRGRPFRKGRCDLWVADVESELCWAFEFKQHFAAAKIRNGTFDQHLEHAYKDARALDREEGDKRVGGLIMIQSDPASDSPELVQHHDDLCLEADLAFRLGSGAESVWVAFRFVT